MGRNTRRRGPAAEIASIAGRRWGVVSREQLLGAGLSTHAIKRWLAADRLHLLHRNVYLVGHRHLEWHGHAYAALLAIGGDAALCGISGCANRKILPKHGGPIHVITSRRSGHANKGIVLRRVHRMPPTEVRHTLRTLRMEPLLLDLAQTQSAPLLQRALNQAAYDGILDLEAVGSYALAARKGGPALREAVARCAPARSYLEDRFYGMLLDAELPPPVANWSVGQYQVDFLWPDHGLIVETDGWAGHGNEIGRARDRRKDLYLRGLGAPVLHVPGHRFEHKPLAVIADVAAAVAVSALNPTRLPLRPRTGR